MARGLDAIGGSNSIGSRVLAVVAALTMSACTTAPQQDMKVDGGLVPPEDLVAPVTEEVLTPEVKRTGGNVYECITTEGAIVTFHYSEGELSLVEENYSGLPKADIETCQAAVWGKISGIEAVRRLINGLFLSPKD